MSEESGRRRTALVVGSTGIVGQNLARELLASGWGVVGLSRGAQVVEGVRGVRADLEDGAGVRAALEPVRGELTDVFFGAWIRRATERENVVVNAGLVEHVLGALDGVALRHVGLVTGTKQYLGPFEAYGQVAAETPFREETPRLPGENFYYAQEDVLFREAKRGGWGWSVHRPHSMVGFAVGNAMNMGSTLAVYAVLCRERGEVFRFPGSREQWNSLADVTDARLLAKHLVWAAVTPAARDQAFNVVNGDVFRWRWLWPQLAAMFGVEWAGPPEVGGPDALEGRMEWAAEAWREVAAKYGLREADVNRLASWWHTDGDLGRTLECVNDMGKSRRMGFAVYQETVGSFEDLFARMRAERLIPTEVAR